MIPKGKRRRKDREERRSLKPIVDRKTKPVNMPHQPPNPLLLLVLVLNPGSYPDHHYSVEGQETY